MINTIELDEQERIFAYEMPDQSLYVIDDDGVERYKAALEAAKRDAVYFKNQREIENILIQDEKRGGLFKGKSYPIPEGYEVQKECTNVPCDGKHCNLVAILVPKEKLDDRLKRYSTKDLIKPKQQPIEEAVKQKSLAIQQMAADKLNAGQKPYIASQLYVEYMNTIINGFEKELIAGAKSQAAKEYWYEQFKKEKL